ncbi:hypothetical protein OGAPHI_003948 [Ogataea philodendri]|uniref:Palmitoyl-protein thioesterase 1 n=1 Tax=Ogataea philodendri TaxID=1378263 RepID=A0A9P8P5U5_9ASCO|nr:uncharacterized protein OGAPHI_003948 [Ogataea philodendri]KAH3665760.1 hypothetical protein OGAPHI_003948 [Ogataea philodendri]
MHVLNRLTELLSVAGSISEYNSLTIDRPKSIVLWHGMGDTYNSTGIRRAEQVFKEEIPGVFVHSVYLDIDEAKDQRASIIGDLNTQVLDVCDQLNSIPELQNGYDAVGFSQGGLFLRSAIELCGLPVKTLVTYGSPHNGVTDLPPCAEGNWLCNQRNEFLKKQIYKDNIQRTVVQAQYFRDVYNFEAYIENSAFLKFVNNEFIKNLDYVDNLTKLEKLVLILFSQDDMVVPKETAWYFDLDPVTNELIPFNETSSFQNDLIGLKTLYEQQKIDFLSIDDFHMRIDEDHLRFIAQKYFK